MMQPADVAAVFDGFPEPHRLRLFEMRAAILQAAGNTGTGPLTEALKWGQPAYLPRRRTGTTLRLGLCKSAPEFCALFVHCQTTLVDQYRDMFPSDFNYVDNREVRVPASGPWPADAFVKLAELGLTYHLTKA